MSRNKKGRIYSFQDYYFKQKILERANGMCENCDEIDALTLHHKIPRCKRMDLIFDEENIVVLCEVCHTLYHMPVYKRLIYIKQKKLKTDKFKYFKWFKLLK